MSITKPFTFVAGTKARANEVNQDFDVLYSQVNSNISAINTNANDIDTLESNKANVNGSSSQRFACADPTSPSDAVNKQSLTKAIGNSINYIDGYAISKDSGSPDDTILVTAGSCYDSTKTVVLAKDTSTTKQNTTQGASTTYYVYVIGNNSGTSVDVLISSSAVTPALPEGYTKFRQIGYYTTDSNSKIDSIYYYLLHNISNIDITLSSFPDYDNAIDLQGLSTYTCPDNGFINISGLTTATTVVLKRNDIPIGNACYQNYVSSSCFVPVYKGDVLTIFVTQTSTATTFSNYSNFYPVKGIG